MHFFVKHECHDQIRFPIASFSVDDDVHRFTMLLPQGKLIVRFILWSWLVCLFIGLCARTPHGLQSWFVCQHFFFQLYLNTFWIYGRGRCEFIFSWFIPCSIHFFLSHVRRHGCENFCCAVLRQYAIVYEAFSLRLNVLESISSCLHV